MITTSPLGARGASSRARARARARLRRRNTCATSTSTPYFRALRMYRRWEGRSRCSRCSGTTLALALGLCFSGRVRPLSASHSQKRPSFGEQFILSSRCAAPATATDYCPAKAVACPAAQIVTDIGVRSVPGGGDTAALSFNRFCACRDLAA